ncbi:hypothetical protein RJ640_004396 [Escallonia rubra]|uniref:Apoptosis inhibitor 5 n=1 Tax=Escallonia rubra TaxID=112253 RepID=A0AA88QSB0_9ASTE|nr:hypothetical protein RJ640_004396 [Escallonia rubra]
MAVVTDVDKLYLCNDRISEATDKSKNEREFKYIIAAAKQGSVKGRKLAAQLIPRFFKYFPKLAEEAIDQHLNLGADEDRGVRVQAIRGFPIFCKDNQEYVFDIVTELGVLLTPAENVERDAVHNALFCLLRQDIETSLTALFDVVGSTKADEICENVLCFIIEKVFPLKAELLKPREKMERHITDLVKKNLQGVTQVKFRTLLDFLRSLSLFGAEAPPERIQELVGIIEGHADLDVQFIVSDGGHIDRLISCVQMALPLFSKGASSSKFLIYFNKHIIPVFGKTMTHSILTSVRFLKKKKVEVLKNLAECSLYATSQDSRQLLPSVVQLLKKHMTRTKIEEMKFTYVECLLYTFHQLAHQTPNATNSLCGYRIVTGQPSDMLGENFSDNYEDFMERLSIVEDLATVMVKKLTLAMAEHNKAMATATDDEKINIRMNKQNVTTRLHTCHNILAMTKPLHSKSPLFIGDGKINLSWKEASKPSYLSTPAVTGRKRAAAADGLTASTNKKGGGAGFLRNRLVQKAFDSLYDGGRTGGRGRGWRANGRRRSYH